MSQLWGDVRYSAKQLVATPTATVVAVLSLGLGIGANIAIFGLINALILRNLPVARPSELVEMHTALPGRATTGQFAEAIPLRGFEELRSRNTVFAGVFAWDDDPLRNIQVDGVQYPGAAIEVTGDYFPVLGVRPFLGRLLTADDAKPGMPAKVAVLDFRCWVNRFHRDPAVVGKVIRIDNIPLTIVGVTPEEFRNLDIDVTVDATVPIGFTGSDITKNWYQVIGRLRHGITLDQARAQVSAIWPEVRKSAMPPDLDAKQRERFLSRGLYFETAAKGSSFLRERMFTPLSVLMCLVATVLLIASANLTGLMLARASVRSRQVAIRIALGAGRWRLCRPVLIESVMLSAAGAAIGFACSAWTDRILLQTAWIGRVALGVDTAPNLRLAIFSAVLAVVAGSLFGIVPALRAAGTDPVTTLQRNSRTSTARDGLFRRFLIMCQVAFSLALVFGAGLFVRTLNNLRNAEIGYRRNGVLCMDLFPQPGQNRIPNRSAYFHELAARVEQVPGVEDASYSNSVPMSFRDFSQAISIWPSGLSTVSASTEMVGPGFFRLIGMHVLAGREFTWTDDQDRPKVAVISKSLARRLFHGAEPLGRHITIANQPEGRDLEIVGVVSNASLWRVQTREPAAVFTPFLQSPPDNQPMFLVRTTRGPMESAHSVENVVQSFGRHYSVKTQSLQQRLDMFFSNERLLAMLSGFFGLLSLILAGIGVYGLLSQTVMSRNVEIGIRMALGAQRGNILRLFLREAMLLCCVGIAAGTGLALIGSRTLGGLLFGVSSFSAVSVATPAAVLLGAGLIAAGIPAYRASRVAPMAALKSE